MEYTPNAWKKKPNWAVRVFLFVLLCGAVLIVGAGGFLVYAHRKLESLRFPPTLEFGGSYDRVTDSSTSRLDLTFASDDEKVRLHLWAWWQGQGKPKEPPTIRYFGESSSDFANKIDGPSPGIAVLCEGKRFIIDASNSQHLGMKLDGYEDSFTIAILRQIARAKSVTLRLWSSDFDLTVEEKAALEKFANRVEQGKVD